MAPVSAFAGRRNSNTTYKKGSEWKLRQTYLQGHDSNGCHLQTSSFNHNVKKDRERCHERGRICPTAKDRKIDWKCCQCSEWVCKGHSIKTIQITCDNCKEQSY